jgi:hypothetical protein
MSKSVPQLTARTSILGNDLFHIVRGNVDFKITWTDISNSITAGSGTLNRVAKWTPSGTELGDSQIFDNGTNVGVNIFTGLSAKLHVKGAGNTSATNGLIVENSSGTQSLVVRDDSKVILNGSNPSGVLSVKGLTTSATEIPFYLEYNDGSINITSFYTTNAGNSFQRGKAQFNIAQQVNFDIIDLYGDGNKNYTLGITSSGLGVGCGGSIELIGNKLNLGGIYDKLRIIDGNTSTTRFLLEYNTGAVGIGTTTPNARLHVKGSGSTSATNTAIFENSSGTQSLVVRDDGFVGVGITPTQKLHMGTSVTSAQEEILITNSTLGVAYGLKGSTSAANNYGQSSAAYIYSGTGVSEFNFFGNGSKWRFLNTDANIGSAMCIVGSAVGFNIDTPSSSTRLHIKTADKDGATYGIIMQDSDNSRFFEITSNRLFSMGGQVTNANALLELIATDKALLLMRMTATQASAITASDGMMLYVTNTNGTFTSIGFWGYENGSWVKL